MATRKETVKVCDGQRSPLGLRPRWIVEEQRLIEVASAASRYLEAGKTVPPPWIEEMIHLIRGIE